LRQKLAHDSLTIENEELWAFARDEMPRIDRAFRKAKTASDAD
jgi:uncharacterized protein with HEPN domain